MIEDVLLCLLVLAWNGFLIYKMRKDDKKEKTRKRASEVSGDADDRQCKPIHTSK